MKQHARLTGWCVLLLTAAATATPAQTGDDPNDLLARSRALRRLFTADKSAAVADATNAGPDASLTALIEQVLSLQTPPTQNKHEIQPDSRVTGRGVPAAGTTESSPSGETVAASASSIAAGSRNDRIDDALASLAELNAPLHPVELADALYRTGRIDAAGRFYRMALDAIDEDDMLRHQWVLFQAGNCLRHSAPDEATSFYRELIRLFPNSSWTSAAQARLRTLEWLHLNQTEIARRTELP